ncbi:ABC transporter permease [Couchioplanes caeruleus]|uniref:ABC transporter permease subunit n=1 Tax=Couchioplanes caeruleus TaxID=56438 RepID=UPI0020C07F7C|nr:ABC transporter permease subunit [Couchioplanes caeruleus]UQU61903.1 ABC transporter permease [Couchioplanes caeruleus]
MVPALMRKTWRDDRRAILGWAAGVTAFTTVYASFYPQLQGAAELKQDTLPQGVLDFLGVADFLSPAGYLQASIFSLLGPLLVLMCTVTVVTRTIAGPEEGGGMELLLANPVSRTAFAGQRLAAAGLAVTVVAAIPWLLLMVIVPAVGMDIPLSSVAAAGFGLVALAWCFGGLAFLVGAATGRRASVPAVTGIVAVATYMANAVSGMAPGWSWLRWWSPFHYFLGTDPLRTGWHPASLLVLVVAGAGAVAAGVILFDRRDVGV